MDEKGYVQDPSVPLSQNSRKEESQRPDALLNPHRAVGSCGVGINFRIAENGDLEVESVASGGE